MPYQTTKELPKGVKSSLPDHAQEIFKSAYNSAYDEYDDKQRAHRVAWGAVKQKYEKTNGSWTRK